MIVARCQVRVESGLSRQRRGCLNWTAHKFKIFCICTLSIKISCISSQKNYGCSRRGSAGPVRGSERCERCARWGLCIRPLFHRQRSHKALTVSRFKASSSVFINSTPIQLSIDLCALECNRLINHSRRALIPNKQALFWVSDGCVQSRWAGACPSKLQKTSS